MGMLEFHSGSGDKLDDETSWALARRAKRSQGLPGRVDSPPERRESVPYGPELLRRQPGQDSVMVMLPVAAPLLDDEVSLRCEADTVEARIPLQASGLRLSLDPPIGM